MSNTVYAAGSVTTTASELSEDFYLSNEFNNWFKNASP